jgi:hypothetical protein
MTAEQVVTMHISRDDAATVRPEVASAVSTDSTSSSEGAVKSKSLGPSSSSAGVMKSPSPQRCPEETASWLSFTYLVWLNPLFALGGHKTLEENDVPAVREDVSAKYISALFREKWTVEKARYDEEEREPSEVMRVLVLGAARLHSIDCIE